MSHQKKVETLIPFFCLALLSSHLFIESFTFVSCVEMPQLSVVSISHCAALSGNLRSSYRQFCAMTQPASSLWTHLTDLGRTLLKRCVTPSA